MELNKDQIQCNRNNTSASHVSCMRTHITASSTWLPKPSSKAQTQWHFVVKFKAVQRQEDSNNIRLRAGTGSYKFTRDLTRPDPGE